MLTPPRGVDPADVLAAARAAWSPDLAVIEHLPVGFGAHHWRAGSLFLTLDGLGARHSRSSLEAAYAGAAALGSTLDFVVAPLRSAYGTRTVPFGDGALSATPWLDGSRPADAAPAVALVAALHAVEAPPALPRWSPLTPPSLPDDLAALARRPWREGPHGEPARALVAAHLTDVRRWSEDYHRLAEVARSLPWVATHGEPHARNLLLTDAGARLVDWESLKLAPAERDLRVLGALGRPGDARMLELFDLEWRLDEVAQYTAWFAGAHGDTEDDRVALAGLRGELERP